MTQFSANGLNQFFQKFKNLDIPSTKYESAFTVFTATFCFDLLTQLQEMCKKDASLYNLSFEELKKLPFQSFVCKGRNGGWDNLMFYHAKSRHLYGFRVKKLYHLTTEPSRVCQGIVLHHENNFYSLWYEPFSLHSSLIKPLTDRLLKWRGFSYHFEKASPDEVEIFRKENACHYFTSYLEENSNCLIGILDWDY